MAIEIRETTVEETAGATGVRIVVSDAPKGAEDVGFRLDLYTKLPLYKAPLLGQVQRQALMQAIEALQTLQKELLQTFPASVRPEPDRRS